MADALAIASVWNFSECRFSWRVFGLTQLEFIDNYLRYQFFAISTEVGRNPLGFEMMAI